MSTEGSHGREKSWWSEVNPDEQSHACLSEVCETCLTKVTNEGMSEKQIEFGLTPLEKSKVSQPLGSGQILIFIKSKCGFSG